MKYLNVETWIVYRLTEIFSAFKYICFLLFKKKLNWQSLWRNSHPGPECCFEPQICCFWSNFLVLHPGRPQVMMPQMLGLLSTQKVLPSSYTVVSNNKFLQFSLPAWILSLWWPQLYFWHLWDHLFSWNPHVSENRWYLSFWSLLISFTIMTFGSIYVTSNEKISSFCDEIIFNLYTNHIVFTHSSIKI